MIMSVRQNLCVWVNLFQLIQFSFTSSSAFAVDTPELKVAHAHDKSVQASQNFYHAVRALGPNPSEDKIKDLETKILLPAKAAESQAVVNYSAQKTKEFRQDSIEATKKIFGAEFSMSWFKGKSKSSDSSDSDSSPGPKSAPIPSTQSTSSAPQTVIDGSKFEKEISFPGKIKKFFIGDPTPAPEPVVEGEGKTGYMEFTPQKPVPPSK